jgi:hypothetical protein
MVYYNKNYNHEKNQNQVDDWNRDNFSDFLQHNDGEHGHQPEHSEKI